MNQAEKEIKVGLIGFGMAGQVFHAPFINAVSGLHLHRIRETKDPRRALAQTRYPKAILSLEADAIFSDPNIDLVVIATPNSAHFELARRALQAGKHVVVEKPFTPTSAQADELILLAQQQQKILTVFHNRRWDSDFKTVQKVVQAGLLGDLVEYRAHFDRFRANVRPNTWKEEAQPGSGLAYDLGSHLLDQALCLFGKPQEIFADLRTQRPGSDVVDQFEIILYYENLKVSLSAGLLVREPAPRYVLHGSKGSFLKSGIDVQEEALKNGQFPDQNSATWGREPEAIWGHLNTEFQGLHFIGKLASEPGDYRAFYQNVVQAIRGEAPLAVTPTQARDVIFLLQLPHQSTPQKRRISVN